ncbi:hypothetical protein TSH58p_09710 [Azospirillum sp. TSH58]|uniref:hypothetical protein n=1 Tax=Azospirillum sp. TSH58 TaxID=664962 RepID=UPI000D600259|nr:hypothetical protein [Azospirillum sp. TSH58]AWJ83778.1 hypothetical protein TSH58p_09710 [Azospirillum sp. TSH58]PWC62721.1 hypothetical protein TSH58_24915 [Azospirillum sp. TSH58]
MSSPPVSAPGFGSSGAYALNGGRVTRVSAATRATPEMMARVGVGDSAFQQQMRIAGDPNAVDPAVAARSRAVQAHTVVRQGGQVVAAVWRDGQTQMGNGLAARLDWTALERQSASLSDAQRRDVIAAAIVKQLGGSAQVQRYGDSGPAPTRGALIDEQAAASRAVRGGR